MPCRSRAGDRPITPVADRGTAVLTVGRIGHPEEDAMPYAAAPLSMWDLFQHADWIVKFVMIGLLITSVAVWGIAGYKMFLYSRTQRAMDGFEQAFWSGQSLDELYRSLASRPTHSLAALFVAAMREWKRSVESQPRSFAGLQMRIEKVMDVTIQREVARLESHLLVLATVGSAGPFIGLFGTVWGIMTSFRAIAGQQTTSLAVVAPGIAEALFATAIGLVAAIPAVMAYNKLATDLGRLGQRLDSAITRVGAELSRERPVGTFQAAE